MAKRCRQPLRGNVHHHRRGLKFQVQSIGKENIDMSNLDFPFNRSWCYCNCRVPTDVVRWSVSPPRYVPYVARQFLPASQVTSTGKYHLSSAFGSDMSVYLTAGPTFLVRQTCATPFTLRSSYLVPLGQGKKNIHPWLTDLSSTPLPRLLARRNSPMYSTK
ncbi:hypothetical protein IF2G_03005 [Cordyceps javanica]|nr:hypothetical protein IF2G_03005 [Cordyceps javanica]